MHFLECQQMSPEKPFATVLIASADLWREWRVQSKTAWGGRRQDDESHGAAGRGKTTYRCMNRQQGGQIKQRDYVKQKENKLGCRHFHMIKQWVIWYISNNVAQLHTRGSLEQFFIICLISLTFIVLPPFESSPADISTNFNIAEMLHSLPFSHMHLPCIYL